ARMRGTLDERDPLAEVGRLGGALLAGRAATDHDQVVVVHDRATLSRRGCGGRRSRPHRRPPASCCASARLRRRAMAAPPRTRPTASGAKAQRHPMAEAMGGISQMLSVVSAKPTQVFVVSA